VSQHIGAIGVSKVSSILLENGFIVSHPVYDNGYDLITDWKGTLNRVQVKTTFGGEDGVKNRSKLKFFALRGQGGQNRSPKKLYGKGIADAFVFYNARHNAIFVIPNDKLPKTTSVYFAPNCTWRDNWDVLRNPKRG